jgi:hypothetical protein
VITIAFNNEYEIKEDWVELIFRRNNGEIVRTKIDFESFERIKKIDIRWYSHYDPKMKSYYVVGYVRGQGRNGKKQKLHRLLMNVDEDKIVDHKNNDTLDNRLENLRVCTQVLNQYNRRNAKNYRKRKDRWNVYFAVNGKYKSFGCFDTEEEAIKVAEEVRNNLIKSI